MNSVDGAATSVTFGLSITSGCIVSSGSSITDGVAADLPTDATEDWAINALLV
jgi:tetrahydrodipicolinate N-succinyltransferase